MNFLGTRIFPALIRLHPENARRAGRKLAAKESLWRSDKLSEAEFLATLNSYQSYFSVYGTQSLRKQVMKYD